MGSGPVRGRVHRPGAPRAHARRPCGRGQAPVPGGGRRGGVGSRQPRSALRRDRQGVRRVRGRPARRGAARAPARGAGLHHRGRSPGPLRRVLPGAPVHPRADGRSGALDPPGPDDRARGGRALRRGDRMVPGATRPRRGGDLPIRVPVLLPVAPLQRRPASRELPVPARRSASRSSTSAWSSGSNRRTSTSSAG